MTFQWELDEAAWVCAGFLFGNTSCATLHVCVYFSVWFCVDLLCLSNLQHSLSHEAKIRLLLLWMDSPSGFHVRLRRRNREGGQKKKTERQPAVAQLSSCRGRQTRLFSTLTESQNFGLITDVKKIPNSNGTNN